MKALGGEAQATVLTSDAVSPASIEDALRQANIPYLIIGGVDGLDERGWEGRVLRIGGVSIALADLRGRCVMTTVDPDTLAQDPKVLRDIVQRFDGRLVQVEKGPFVGQAALRKEKGSGPARQIVGLEISWEEVEALYEALELPPQVPATASRVAVPVYRDGSQVGKATSTTWSPVLKKMIALATIDHEAASTGSRVQMEMTVEAVRHRVNAAVVPTPFFNPPSKTAPASA